MSDHSFNPFLAEKYGINEAILINNFIFWTRTNAAKPKDKNNFFDNRYWVFGTPEYFANYFPYFSANQIKYALKNMLKSDVLIKGNYNKKGYDKTNWYALSDNILSELNLDVTCLKPAPALIGQNCPIDRTKLSNASDKIVRPIPDTKPDTKPDDCVGEASASTAPTILKKLQKEKAEAKALEDKNIRSLFENKFSDREITIEELFLACQEHYEQKSLWATKDKFLKWVTREDPNNYKKTKSESQNLNCPFTTDELSIISEYTHGLRNNQIEIFFPKQEARDKAYQLYLRATDANKGRMQTNTL